MVDAPGLGPDASNGVGVRVPSLAPHPLNAPFLPVAGFTLAGGSRRSALSIAWRVGHSGEHFIA
ncbi:hypothetical protein RSPO_c01739 [Ralstonia solanacearum Po82]|uniref:Uncharacterized protein n=1 Tax=Ralstonia solanacearum (strain Po82) TaxID=1031711 RepID=F6G1G9_RALS8|nr:hypothetical protein RSPO_c01739 [Ralstonia solanacearum Po82]